MKRGTILLIILLFLAQPAWSASLESASAVPAGPIDITAQRLDVDETSGTAVFTGEVVAKRGDMTVYAEKLILYRAGKTEQLDRIEASGGVRVVQQNRVGTAQRVVYEQRQEKLTLSGEARLQQGQNQVTGEEIILFISENRSLVKSGEDGKVRAVFFPEQELK